MLNPDLTKHVLDYVASADLIFKARFICSEWNKVVGELMKHRWERTFQAAVTMSLPVVREVGFIDGRSTGVPFLAESQLINWWAMLVPPVYQFSSTRTGPPA